MTTKEELGLIGICAFLGALGVGIVLFMVFAIIKVARWALA